MSNGNFPNGTLVMRVWRFDGSGEIVAKFQYFSSAELFCKAQMEWDWENGANKENGFFYPAVCDYECKFRAFGANGKADA